MHRLRTLSAVLAAALGVLAAGASAEEAKKAPPDVPYTPEITADQVLKRIAFLAADELDGRESGTEFGRRTEEWVASEFARFGLEPLSATKDSPFTEVPFAGRPVAEESWIEFGAGEAKPQRVSPEKGSGPFAFSASGEAAGGLVFAGFGISAAKDGYDDYEGADVKGKVVLVLRHGPGEKDTKSPWSRPASRARETAFAAKAARAASAGAVALLIVNDMNHTEDELPVEAPAETAAIPVVAVRRATADLLLAPLGKKLAELQAEIDADRKPKSRAVAGMNVRVKATIAGTTARNVVFVRRGSDPALRDEAVLVCAHIDHVGRGFFGSLAKGAAGQIHNGADDNASGTASVLEVAEALAAGPPTKRSIVFAGWCGEEKGLVGSAHFAKNPLWDLKNIAACVNLDMVGRYRDAAPQDAGLIVEGTSTAVGTADVVRRLAEQRKLRCTTDTWDAWEQSDHMSFYVLGVPSLFLHTGLHAEYHRPADDWWLVPAEPQARIAQMTADLVHELADAPSRPVFAKRPPRPVIGVRMDDAGGAGAKIVAVVPGFGAAAAGLQINDVVTRIGDVKVKSASDLTAVILSKKPGDVVEIEYVRDGKTATAKVTISGR
jgi:hypothetical protein